MFLYRCATPCLLKCGIVCQWGGAAKAFIWWTFYTAAATCSAEEEGLHRYTYGGLRPVWAWPERWLGLLLALTGPKWLWHSTAGAAELRSILLSPASAIWIQSKWGRDVETMPINWPLAPGSFFMFPVANFHLNFTI